MRNTILSALIIFTYLFAVSCEDAVNSNDCVEEFAGIQEIIAPDTVNVNESLNIEMFIG